jgi:hypothetical protein
MGSHGIGGKEGQKLVQLNYRRRRGKKQIKINAFI